MKDCKNSKETPDKIKQYNAYCYKYMEIILQ